MFHTLSIVLPLVEQQTGEEECSDAVSGELSDLRMKTLDSVEEATQSKESVFLSMVDDLSEIIVEDSGTEELTPDVTVEDVRKIRKKDGLETSAVDFSSHG